MKTRRVLTAFLIVLITSLATFDIGAENKMILVLYPPPDNEPITISTAPNEQIVISSVKAQPWDDITFIILKIDEKNWLEVSGSLKPEVGLSARYTEAGVEHVSKRAPEDLNECIKLLSSYLRGDDKWRKDIPWD